MNVRQLSLFTYHMKVHTDSIALSTFHMFWQSSRFREEGFDPLYSATSKKQISGSPHNESSSGVAISSLPDCVALYLARKKLLPPRAHPEFEFHPFINLATLVI